MGKAQNDEEMLNSFDKSVDMLKFDAARLYGRDGSVRSCRSEDSEIQETGETESLMRMEIPLKVPKGNHLGKMVLIKDMQKGDLQRKKCHGSDFTLLRGRVLGRSK